MLRTRCVPTFASFRTGIGAIWQYPLDGQRAPGRHILSHGGDRYFNAGGKFKFLRSLKHHYTYYTREWYSPRGRAWTELKNILLDNDQVKAVAAAHPVKMEMDNIFNMACSDFKAQNNDRLPEMNQADMQKMVDLVVSIGKNYRLR